MKRKLLVSITTILGDSWQDKIAEVDQFGLKEIALFVTCLNEHQRAECYKMLETIPDLEIPFVHARTDMHPNEFRFLMDSFGTKLFNLHPAREMPYLHDLSTLKNQICIENSGPLKTLVLREEDVEGYGGLCLDMSHLEEERILRIENYTKISNLIKPFGVRANHISAISAEAKPSKRDNSVMRHSFHLMEDLSELDYLKNYPEYYFGDYLAIELENSIAEQIQAKNHIESILGDLLA